MLEYKENELHVESISLHHVSEKFGTPVYVYSKAKVKERVAFVLSPLRKNGAEIHFPVKCNFNLAILDLLRREGLSFDVASEGELRRVLQVGADPSRVVFTGVGKTKKEIQFALDVRIGCFHVESSQELKLIENVAACSNKTAPIALRVNANIATQTHGYIATGSCNTKFGIPLDEAESLYIEAHASKYLSVEGIHCHIGSQITDIIPYEQAISAVLSFVQKLKSKGIRLKFYDIGGGFGVHYKPTDPVLKWDEWLEKLVQPIIEAGLQIHVEPGRVLVAESGVLLTEVLYTKRMADKHYVIVDAAMNDFIRPALYDGYHEIVNIQKQNKEKSTAGDIDIVGPLCESSDIMGLNRRLSAVPGDILAITMAGAYGSAIMSNFSSRPRPPEVVVDGEKVFLIKERETYEHLMSLDKIPSY